MDSKRTPAYIELCRGLYPTDVDMGKQFLADRVMKSKGLTAGERDTVYYILTGNVPIKGNPGRRSTALRDIAILREFLEAYSVSKDKAAAKKRSLIKSYDLSEIDDSFYACLRRAIPKLEKNASKFCQEYDRGKYIDKDPAFIDGWHKDATRILELIAIYKEATAKKKRDTI